MAKRFTDTAKWDHTWFRKLSPKMKCTWFYVLDKCDHAGVWTADIESLSFHVGEPVRLSELEEVFYEKIQRVDEDKFVIKSFIEFQYGTLNPENRVHLSVILRLEKLGAYKDLTSPLQGAKDKDKEKDKDKDKEKKENFFEILNPLKVTDLSMREAERLKEFEQALYSEHAFGNSPPTLFKKTKTKFLATLAFVYPSTNDFKADLTSIVNEGLADTKQGPSRAVYVETRVKNKALELYNAAL